MMNDALPLWAWPFIFIGGIAGAVVLLQLAFSFIFWADDQERRRKGRRLLTEEEKLAIRRFR